MARTMTGGCQCGRVRYTAQVASDEAYLCHCRMCQRATGGVAAAMKNLAQADVSWHGAPDWYASSPIARRPFCAACGTPLGFAYNDSENMDLTVGSFDDPGAFYPTGNFGAEHRHAAWEDTSHLPAMRVADNPRSVELWAAAGRAVPD